MNSPCRILVVLHDTELSGAPRVALRVAGLLREGGGDVEIATPGEGPAAAAARAQGFRVHPVAAAAGSAAALPLAGRLRAATARVAAIARLALLLRRGGFGLCWAGSAMAYTAVLAASLARVPSIAHIHETLEPTRGNRARIAVLRRCCRALAFVAPSCRRGFGRRPRGQRWRLLPNAIGESPRLPSREEAREALQLDARTPLALCVAYLSPRKGIDVLLDAWALVAGRVPGARLWVAGGVAAGSEAWAEALKSRAREDPALAGARFLGQRDDVPLLLAASDLLVLASRNEALPLVILEAMASGRAVVATNVGSVGWLLGRDGGRVVEPGDAGALAREVAGVLRDKSLRQALAVAGQRRARTRFSAMAQRRALQGLLP